MSNHMDFFFEGIPKLINAAKYLNVDIFLPECPDFYKQKLVVKQEVLNHLLREPPSEDSEKYEELLSETKAQLVIQRQRGFRCIYVGCPFKGSKHRDYVKHLKNNHFVEGNFQCNFILNCKQPCKQRFASISLLEHHVSQVHQKRNVPVLEAGGGGGGENDSARAGELELSIPCKCILSSCGHQQFTSIKKLRLHYSSHIHSSERRPCIFAGCNQIFSPNYKCRNHYLQKHSRPHQQRLKPEFLLVVTSISTDNTQDSSVNPGADTESESAETEQMDTDDVVEDDNPSDGEQTEDHHASSESSYQMFLMAYADFLNRLAFVNMVSQSTIQIITQEYYTLCKLAIRNRKAAVFQRLKSENVPAHIIEKVMAELEQDDSIKAQEELNSAYKREEFVKKNFKFNAPIEIILNKDEVKLGKPKETYQYIPVKRGIKLLFEDPTFNKVLEKSGNVQRDANEDLLVEIRDGSLIKAIPYFQENPSSYVGLLYSDAVEIVSPLGSSRGRYKILQMFWSIGDISKQFRSKVDNINLCIIVQDALLKKYGYNKIYKPLIEELKEVESTGILLEFPYRRRIKVAFAFHIGDNLESHSLGGFSRCFSSKDICRFCHCCYDELESKIHDFTSLGKHQYWTIGQYDERAVRPAEPTEVEVAVTEENLFDEIDEPGGNNDVIPVEPDEETEMETQQYGLRERCPLNELRSFHAVYSFPPDSLHDILEGNFMTCQMYLFSTVLLFSRRCFRRYLVCFENSHLKELLH